MSDFDALSQLVCERLGREPGEALLLEICRALHGRRVYIPRHPLPRADAGESVEGLRERYRVSRSTGYSWVNRWRG